MGTLKFGFTAVLLAAMSCQAMAFDPNKALESHELKSCHQGLMEKSECKLTIYHSLSFRQTAQFPRTTRTQRTP